MGNLFAGPHLWILLIVILLLFGAAKLPALAKSMGQSARIFKGEMKAMKDDDKTAGAAEASTVDSTAVGAQGQNDLYTIARNLQQYPDSTIQVVGHTDSTGSNAINNPLSLNRANAARNYLVSRGVSGSRIVTSGMGSSQPIASNATEAGRAQNRRVEIYVAERPR